MTRPSLHFYVNVTSVTECLPHLRNNDAVEDKVMSHLQIHWRRSRSGGHHARFVFARPRSMTIIAEGILVVFFSPSIQVAPKEKFSTVSSHKNIARTPHRNINSHPWRNRRARALKINLYPAHFVTPATTAGSLQPPAHAGSSLADFSTLKMEPIRSSETSVYTRSTRLHIQEDGILHIHRRENLKSYKAFTCFAQWWPSSEFNHDFTYATDLP
jgi:hypothetical protein